jgi:hypothetical protein
MDVFKNNPVVGPAGLVWIGAAATAIHRKGVESTAFNRQQS